MNGPNYQIVPVPLGQAGTLRLTALGNWIQMVDARTSEGAQSLDALVTVELGDRTDDRIPLGINGAIQGRSAVYVLRWAAQPGVTAQFLLSMVDGVGEGIRVNAPPAKQLVTQAAGLAIRTGTTAVGTVATLIVPANTNRQAVTLRNRSGGPIIIGDPTVTLLTGYVLEPGEAYTVSGTTAAVWGIAYNAGLPCNWIEEG